MGSIIECVKRTYTIQTNGIKIQVESEKPLTGTTTAKLLENDSEIKDISSLLENCKILDIEKVFKDKKISSKKKLKTSSKKKLKTASKKKLKTPSKKKLKTSQSEKKLKRIKREEIPSEDIKREIPSEDIKREIPSEDIKREIPSEDIKREDGSISSTVLTPHQRLNELIKMKGEFTRIDYQKCLEDSGHKISSFTGHNDIKEAVGIKRIEPIGAGKTGKGAVPIRYRVIDSRPVEEYMYRKIIKNFRAIKKHKRMMRTNNMPKSKSAKDSIMLNPCQRLNELIKIQGEFTRIDYQKLLEDSGYKISDSMGHGDIEDALTLRRIELVGKKVPKQFVKYRVIDSNPIEEHTYRDMMKSNRETQNGVIRAEIKTEAV